MSLISDHIEELILQLLAENDGEAKFNRSLIADSVECAPSQISYVLQTRFNYLHGYLTESRRGEGGYIIVRRIKAEPSGQELRHFAYNLPDSLGLKETQIMLDNLSAAGHLSPELATVMQAVNLELGRPRPDLKDRDFLRADLVRAMLMAIFAEKSKKE